MKSFKKAYSIDSYAYDPKVAMFSMLAGILIGTSESFISFNGPMNVLHLRFRYPLDTEKKPKFLNKKAVFSVFYNVCKDMLNFKTMTKPETIYGSSLISGGKYATHKYWCLQVTTKEANDIFGINLEKDFFYPCGWSKRIPSSHYLKEKIKDQKIFLLSLIITNSGYIRENGNFFIYYNTKKRPIDEHQHIKNCNNLEEYLKEKFDLIFTLQKPQRLVCRKISMFKFKNLAKERYYFMIASMDKLKYVGELTYIPPIIHFIGEWPELKPLDKILSTPIRISISNHCSILFYGLVKWHNVSAPKTLEQIPSR